MLKSIATIFLFLIYITSNSYAIQSNIEDEKFNKKIKDFLINHPEIIIESLDNYKKNSEEIFHKKISSYIKENLNKIEDTNISPYVGNIKGDITIVMFFDYSCGYCKKANIVVNELLNKDKNIKLIYKPYPVLGEISSYTTQIALSVYLQYPNKFKELHDNIMAENKPSEASIEVILKKNNIDLSQLLSKTDLNKLNEIQKETLSIAKNLYISGIPTFIINGNIYRGMISYTNLLKLIEDIRQKNNLKT